jgi:hypothetical protein
MESTPTGKAQSFYIAVILYESSSDAPQYTPLYQECFVLIKAESLEEAHRKALNHAEAENVSYLNEKGETITWSLQQIVDVNSVLDEHLEDGAELYARHFRNYDAYRQFEELSREDGESEVGKETADE